MIETHLFNQHARDEKALRGADAAVHDLTTVQRYLEPRRQRLSLPTMCNPCKVPAIQFARMRSAELADGGMPDEAQTYRRLADTLSRETEH